MKGHRPVLYVCRFCMSYKVTANIPSCVTGVSGAEKLFLDRMVKNRAPQGGFCMFCMAKNEPTYKPTYKKNPVIPRV